MNKQSKLAALCSLRQAATNLLNQETGSVENITGDLLHTIANYLHHGPSYLPRMELLVEKLKKHHE